jgi:predicted unusual protein kinase regulating ubiquinone biosynthesis (AarF/ABC1/UbiB family)
MGDESLRVLAKELAEVLTRLGPLYIKLGQALSSRQDLIGRIIAGQPIYDPSIYSSSFFNA